MTSSAGMGVGLETIGKDGVVPETRMKSAAAVIDMVRRLWDNDDKRSYKRSRVDGLIGGNPPYSTAKLRNAGRAEACNVNWGSARMYMESGSGAFYDLATEAPGLIGILTSYGDDESKRDEWSRVMSSEADRILQNDESWDFEQQNSQDQMVCHGRGPYVFEDPYTVLPIAVHDADVKVPERTRADTKYWEFCSIDRDYYPPELYDFIKNEKTATAAGWDVEYTKQVISNAMEVRQPNGQMYSWEFYQQEIKNNSLSYYDDSLVSHLALVFWKEFDGTITEAIVERESTGQSDYKYLFFHRGRYKTFQNCVHPMYFDRGNNGYHHSVTGLGVKMYGGMEYENRLVCNLMDKTFAPKILFKPTTAEASKKMELATFGDWGAIPPGWDSIQNPIQGFLSDGLAMLKASGDLMRSNLSSYRQNAPMKQEGNPITRAQVIYDASQQSTLSKTTYNRFYRQMDLLYTEIVRRLCNLNSTDNRAKEYQKRCMERGVPKECFGRIDRVRAVRVIGQGSAFMRKQAVDAVGGIAGSLPEDGRQNWLNDKIACEAGQDAVARYNPQRKQKTLPDDQQFMAQEGIAMMKTGMAPLVTSSQNPLTFAAAYLSAATQALQSLQQGANPLEIIRFLDLCGPAIAAHLRRFAKDPLRQEAWKAIFNQWKQLSKITDGLKKQTQQRQQQLAQQRQKTQAAMSDSQIKQMKAQNDIRLRTLKTRAAIAERTARTRQDLAIADARAASDIHRNNLMAFKE